MQLHRSTIEECWRPPGDQALSVAYKRRRRVHLAWTGGNRFAALLMLALVLIDGLSFNSHAGPANTLGSTMSERSACTRAIDAPARSALLEAGASERLRGDAIFLGLPRRSR